MQLVVLPATRVSIVQATCVSIAFLGNISQSNISISILPRLCQVKTKAVTASSVQLASSAPRVGPSSVRSVRVGHTNQIVAASTTTFSVGVYIFLHALIALRASILMRRAVLPTRVHFAISANIVTEPASALLVRPVSMRMRRVSRVAMTVRLANTRMLSRGAMKPQTVSPVTLASTPSLAPAVSTVLLARMSTPQAATSSATASTALRARTYRKQGGVCYRTACIVIQASTLT